MKAQYWHVYVRRATIYLPVVADTPSGYMDVEPTKIVSCGQWDIVRRIIHEFLTEGNPIGRGYVRDEFPKPRAFDGSGVRSWAGFKRGAAVIGWIVTDDARRVDFIEDMGKSGRAGYEPTVVAEFGAGVTSDEFVDCILLHIRRACDLQREAR